MGPHGGTITVTKRCLLLGALWALGGALSPAPAAEPGPWATYRGNPQRTGNTDGKPGPDKPAVLWVLKPDDVQKRDDYIAAPVPVGTRVAAGD